MTPEFKSALTRGAWQSGCGALLTALIFLPSNLEWRTYVSIVFVPAVQYFGARVFGEGWYDSMKATQPGTPQAAARVVREQGNGG